MCAKSLPLCPTLCGPANRSPAGSSVRGILQARILERVAVCPAPGDLPEPGVEPYISSLFGLSPSLTSPLPDTSTHAAAPSHPIPPLRSSQSTELRPLFSSFWLAVCFTQTVCICQCCFLNLSHPLLPALCPQVGSPRQHLYSCPANRFI